MKFLTKDFHRFYLAIGAALIALMVFHWVISPMLASRDDPSTFNTEEFSSRFADTEAAGEVAAARDIKNGVRRLIAFGFIDRHAADKIKERLGRYGIQPVFGPCTIGGPGSVFWAGYNAAVRADAKKRFNLSSAEAASISQFLSVDDSELSLKTPS